MLSIYYRASHMLLARGWKLLLSLTQGPNNPGNHAPHNVPFKCNNYVQLKADTKTLASFVDLLEK